MLSDTGVHGGAVEAAVARCEAAIAELRELDCSALGNPDRLQVMTRLEALARTLPAVAHPVINQLAEQHAPDEYKAGNLTSLLADTLRLTGKQARARIRTAARLGETRTLDGRRMEPERPAVAAAQLDGALGQEHVAVIEKFFRALPDAVGADERAEAEAILVRLARQARPDQVAAAAERLLGYLNPDGTLDSESDRARKAYFHLNPQGADKMSTGSFCVDPETRAYLEAFFAKYAKPGVANPDDEHPVTEPENEDQNSSEPEPSGDPTDRPGGTDSPGATVPEPDSAAQKPDAPREAAAARDTRTEGKRQHDALKLLLRHALASGKLGQHRGLPVTAVLTMSMRDLQDAARSALTRRYGTTASPVAVTGGGTLIPIRDAIRLARHAYHYLAIFDDHTGRPLYLGRAKRLASPDQRIVLHSSDRGCTFPNCINPAYRTQTHHIDEWAHSGNTDVDRLTLACDIHHALIGPDDTDWATSTAGPTHPYPGRTLWHPPTHLDPTRQGRVNHHFHPEEYLLDTEHDSTGHPPRAG